MFACYTCYLFNNGFTRFFVIGALIFIGIVKSYPSSSMEDFRYMTGVASYHALRFASGDARYINGSFTFFAIKGRCITTYSGTLLGLNIKRYPTHLYRLFGCYFITIGGCLYAIKG